jgi:hypothetical protein
VQHAKRLPELVAKIYCHAQDDHRGHPSAGPPEPGRAPYQKQTQGAKGRHGEHHDPHRPIVPLQEAALAVAAVATVVVNRIQGMRAAPAMLGVVHEPYPAVRSQVSLIMSVPMSQWEPGQATYLELNPVPTGEHFALGNGVDFPESTPRLANLIGMLGVEHEPAGQAHPGTLLGQSAERL